MRNRLKIFGELLREASRQWLKDNAPRMGAALAYYTAFSLAPLLILVVAVSGWIFTASQAQHQIIAQIKILIGSQGAQAVDTMINAARRPESGRLAGLLSVITLMLGATGAVVELQDGLNRVWKVPESSGLKIFLRQRLVSMALVMGIAFLLLVSLVVSTVLAALGILLGGRFPVHQLFLQGVDFVLSLGVTTLLFSMIFKILPDVPVRWRDVWVGSAVTSVLFTLGKFLVGLYIGKSATTSAYGAAGSFVVVLMWVYYSALLFYYGAEFTKAYADHYSPARDKSNPNAI